MRLEDVTYTKLVIREYVAFDKSLNELNGSSLSGGTITINRDGDILSNCKMDHCKIVTTKPLTIRTSIITDSKEKFDNVEIPKDDLPHPLILDCYFTNCLMPDAKYIDCIIDGNPHFFKTNDK